MAITNNGRDGDEANDDHDDDDSDSGDDDGGDDDAEFTMTHNAYFKIIFKYHLHSLSKSSNSGCYRQNIGTNAVQIMGKKWCKMGKKAQN